MNFLKNNKKLIAGIAIGVLTTTGIGYATNTYFAGDIRYTKSGASNSISVAEALNELYQNKKETSDETKQITSNGNQTLDKYYKNLNVNVVSDKKYTESEYQTYGNIEYQRGVSDTANTNNYITGKLNIDEMKTYTVNCNFKPKYVMITRENADGTAPNINILFYNEKMSTQQTYRYARSLSTLESYTMGTSNSSLNITNITNTGFEVYNSGTNSSTLFWVAFK